ncbi:MAG: glycine oxidase ThiO [Vulcanimicrobiaceae bacterium]
MSRETRGGDVAVVGAGLIGLAIAFELAERGAMVRVFDRGEPGRAASWAGAGMLAPYTEHIEDEAMLELCARSLRAYPAFVERVQAASGIDPHLHLDGIVHAAFDALGVARLSAHAIELARRGIAHDILDREKTLALEPWLGTHVLGALLVRGEGNIDNRRFGRALAAACDARGVTFVRKATDLAVECDDRRVLGVRSGVGFAPCSVVVNATGAWAATLPGVPAAAAPPVYPVKGQMLALALPRGFVRHTTWVPGAYMVPREDGRLLIGATAENDDFDQRVTAGGIRQLLDAALAAAPTLADFSIGETWAGLRPGTSDGRPFLGRTPVDGLLLATGHYRNGILLAPVTAALLASSIDGSLAPGELDAFSLGRDATEVERTQRTARA